MEYFEPRLPCDATQVGRFRQRIGEAGAAELVARAINTAVSLKAIKPAELETIIVDSTVQEKAIAHPTNSRLMGVARRKLVQLARQAGSSLKQTFEREGKKLCRKAGGYAHARQLSRRLGMPNKFTACSVAGSKVNSVKRCTLSCVLLGLTSDGCCEPLSG